MAHKASGVQKAQKVAKVARTRDGASHLNTLRLFQPGRLAIRFESHPLAPVAGYDGHVDLIRAPAFRPERALEEAPEYVRHTRTATFDGVVAGYEYSAEIRPTGVNPVYALFRDRRIAAPELCVQEPPEVWIRAVVPRLVYDDDEQKPLRLKHVYIDAVPAPPAAESSGSGPHARTGHLQFAGTHSATSGTHANAARAVPARARACTDLTLAGESWRGSPDEPIPLIAARTDTNGFLSLTLDEDGTATCPLWVDVEQSAHRMMFSDTPLDPATITRHMCQPVELIERDRPVEERSTDSRKAMRRVLLGAGPREFVYRLKRLVARMEIKVSFESVERTQQWLEDNTIRVDVDGERIESGARVLKKDKIVVEFRLEPGLRQVVISTVQKTHDRSGRHRAFASANTGASDTPVAHAALDMRREFTAGAHASGAHGADLHAKNTHPAGTHASAAHAGPASAGPAAHPAPMAARPTFEIVTRVRMPEGWAPADREPDDARRTILAAGQFTVRFSG